MTITKKSAGTIIVGLWLVASTAYIALDQWNHFQVEKVDMAYKLGRTETINQAIGQALSQNCEPFAIWNDQKRVQLINVACLQQADNGQPNADKQPEAKPQTTK